MSGDVMGAAVAVALFSTAAWWWGRGVNRRPDPETNEIARGAWRFAPVGVVVGLCVAIAAAFAQCR